MDNGKEFPTKSNKLVTLLVVIALAIVAIGIGTFLYWGSQPENILEVKNSPFPTRTIREHPTAGGVVFLDVDFCKNYEVRGVVRVSFVSPSREVFLPLAPENGPKQCLHTEVPIVIPKDLPPDNYKIKFRATYDLNPIKKGIVSEFESGEFKVE